MCQYLHKIESKGKNVKKGDIHDSAEPASVIEPIKSTNDVEKEMYDTSEDKNNEDHNDKEEMIVDMEEEALNKDELIAKLETKYGTLETENKSLKEQLEQLKRVVMNMNYALKAKK